MFSNSGVELSADEEVSATVDSAAVDSDETEAL